MAQEKGIETTGDNILEQRVAKADRQKLCARQVDRAIARVSSTPPLVAATLPTASIVSLVMPRSTTNAANDDGVGGAANVAGAHADRKRVVADADVVIAKAMHLPSTPPSSTQRAPASTQRAPSSAHTDGSDEVGPTTPTPPTPPRLPPSAPSQRQQASATMTTATPSKKSAGSASRSSRSRATSIEFLPDVADHLLTQLDVLNGKTLLQYIAGHSFTMSKNDELRAAHAARRALCQPGGVPLFAAIVSIHDLLDLASFYIQPLAECVDVAPNFGLLSELDQRRVLTSTKHNLIVLSSMFCLFVCLFLIC